MSRTRKTRPLLVRMADEADKGVGVREHHDHVGKSCSLPGSVKEQIKLAHGVVFDLNCYYDWSYNGHSLCGCPMCTDRWGKEQKRVRRRREGKEAARNGVVEN